MIGSTVSTSHRVGAQGPSGGSQPLRAIPAPFLGSGTYLIDVQNHASSPDPELVEGGQLLVLRIPPGKPASLSPARTTTATAGGCLVQRSTIR